MKNLPLQFCHKKSGNVKRIEKGKEDFIFVGWTILDIKYSDSVPISSNNRSTQGIRVNKSSAK